MEGYMKSKQELAEEWVLTIDEWRSMDEILGEFGDEQQIAIKGFLAGYEAALTQPIPIGPNTMVISNPTEGTIGGISRNRNNEDLCPKCNKPYTRVKTEIDTKKSLGFCDRCQWCEEL